MSQATAAVDRFISFVLAVVALFFSAWILLYFFRVRFALDATEYVNQRIWRAAPTLSWFDILLGAIVVVGVVVGVLLIWKNLVRHRFSRVRSDSASTEDGSIHFNIADIAKAVAGELSQTPKVESVPVLVSVDRGRPTVQFTVNGRADASVPVVRGQIEQAERDFREAIGDVDVDTTYLLHLSAVER